MRKGLGLILTMGLLAGCAAVADKPAPATAVDSRLVEGHLQFGFDLMRQIWQEKPGDNLVLSPASAALVLSLTANGAQGETEAAMLEGLRLKGMTLTEINQASQALQSVLANPDAKVTVEIANSIWYEKGLKLKKPFVDLGRQQYQAEVKGLDFSRPASLTTINDWVKKATHGRIPTIVDKLDGHAYLINAVYFHGTWSEPFDKALTKERPFTRLDGSSSQRPMMSATDRYGYLKGDGFQAVRLPYGEGRLAMYLFVPDQVDGLIPFLQGLSAQGWQGWMGQFKQQRGTVVMPRVKVEDDRVLNDALKAMGMGIAFDGRADFTGLTEGVALYISLVRQKTFLEINEEGTEAAAATAVVMTSSARPGEPFEVVADHPYFVAIRDDRTGAVLFTAAIVNPQ